MWPGRRNVTSKMPLKPALAEVCFLCRFKQGKYRGSRRVTQNGMQLRKGYWDHVSTTFRLITSPATLGKEKSSAPKSLPWGGQCRHYPGMHATNCDERRRVTFPADLEPRSAV